MSVGQYRDLFDLSGRAAIVTGACGIIGREFCAALADFGASVAAIDLDAAQVEALAEDLSEIYGERMIGLACDIADPDAVAAMVQQVERALGPLRILANNAATKTVDVGAFLASVEEYDLDTWRQVNAVNLDGAFVVAQAVGRRMIAHGQGGSIIQTASIYGVLAPDNRIYEGSDYAGRPISTPPVYAASKAGIVGLTRYLAAVWAADSIRVNTLTPGGVQSGQNWEFRARYADRVPLGRMARANEMTGALIYLASDAASYVTGQNILVDGGLSAW